MSNTNVKEIGLLFFASEWDTTKGGLSSFNIEIAEECAKEGKKFDPPIKIWCAVPQCSAEQKKHAMDSGVTLVLPKKFLLNSPLDSFSTGIEFPSSRDVESIVAVIGHAHISGDAAKEWRDENCRNAKFVFFNHITPLMTDPVKNPNDEGKKKHEKLLSLAKVANLVFSVGPRMFAHFNTEYITFDRELDHYQYIPPLSTYFKPNPKSNLNQAGETRVLCFGRAEDEKVKGFDIIAKAMGGVSENNHYLQPSLVARGIPEGEIEPTRTHLHELASSSKCNITVHSFGTREEIRNDLWKSALAVMPSRSEPFGLVALEALAAGVLVLISSQSGVAEYLKSLQIGADSIIVDVSSHDSYIEKDAKAWTNKIVEALNNANRSQLAANLRQRLIEADKTNKSVEMFLKLCIERKVHSEESLPSSEDMDWESSSNQPENLSVSAVTPHKLQYHLGQLTKDQIQCLTSLLVSVWSRAAKSLVHSVNDFQAKAKTNLEQVKEWVAHQMNHELQIEHLAKQLKESGFTSIVVEEVFGKFAVQYYHVIIKYEALTGTLQAEVGSTLNSFPFGDRNRYNYLLKEDSPNFQPSFQHNGFWEDAYDYYVVLKPEAWQQNYDREVNMFRMEDKNCKTLKDESNNETNPLVIGFFGTKEFCDAKEQQMIPNNSLFLLFIRGPRMDCKMPRDIIATHWWLRIDEDETNQGLNGRRLQNILYFCDKIYMREIVATAVHLVGSFAARLDMILRKPNLEQLISATVSILVWCSYCKARVTSTYKPKAAGSKLLCTVCKRCWCK